MNYKIDAMEILLQEDCILQRYHALIPYKTALIHGLQQNGCLSRDECAGLPDESLLKIGLPNLEMVRLFRNFLVMYDVPPQKMREADKISGSEEERDSFRELYLLPGVRAVRAKLYYAAGYKYLRPIADASPGQIISDTAEVIRQQDPELKVPLLKEAKTHVAVAKVYTYYKA